jgi:hypothetical protein
MTRYLLDMNDAELRIARISDSVEVVAQSIGFALVDSRDVTVGEQAMQQFRLHPRQANNQFWNRLSTDALPVRGPDTATYADLVYRQLRELAARAQIGAGDELHVAVAGSTSADQLGLLVGIAGEIGLTVCGLADAAITASVRGQGLPQRHVDVQLHRIVVTEMTPHDGSLARQRTHEIGELGLAGLMEAWLNVLADRFVRDTRFDPLSIAATDQQLFTQLHQWLNGIPQRNNMSVEIQYEGTPRRAELPADALSAKVAQRYRLLDAFVHAVPVVLSHRAARLPGLLEHVRGVASDVAVLDTAAVFDGFVAAQDTIRCEPDALRLTTRLPFAGKRAAAVTPAAARVVAAPSHVLRDADALPLCDGFQLTAEPRAGTGSMSNAAPRIVAREGGYLLQLGSESNVRLNGRAAVNGALLAKGDVVEVAGVRFLLIDVRDAS